MSEDKVFNKDKAQKLIDPEREKIVPINKVLELLQLNGDEKVVDLGAGNGYLTLPIARETKDRVTAVDLQFEMLDMLDQRANDEELTNIDRLNTDLSSLNLPDSSFQRAVAAFVLHEVPSLSQTLEEIGRVLTEHSRFLVLDWEAVESEQGPPLNHRISSTEMAEQLAKADFEVEVGHFNKDVYYIVATK
ncbi:methyltransferase domain-containing protein [Pontibacillus yanchengensis]|uniref:Methyltransferase domain-containing protein n=2 Tax=Pontibacillus yanchengensis TaxID=462910 RepID=A0ACC7VC87_9BACI|nr:class I SAM-dependent methyltransferase [Pontibacillus yanchengensis]MYL34734.1 methyltransferase domain-containing protein [Pontibacillus yanchengensis]MYL52280.1 methyltransferase domain-containing protein [Pontibacillus yanchengensis]